MFKHSTREYNRLLSISLLGTQLKAIFLSSEWRFLSIFLNLKSQTNLIDMKEKDKF